MPLCFLRLVIPHSLDQKCRLEEVPFSDKLWYLHHYILDYSLLLQARLVVDLLQISLFPGIVQHLEALVVSTGLEDESVLPSTTLIATISQESRNIHIGKCHPPPRCHSKSKGGGVSHQLEQVDHHWVQDGEPLEHLGLSLWGQPWQRLPQQGWCKASIAQCPLVPLASAAPATTSPPQVWLLIRLGCDLPTWISLDHFGPYWITFVQSGPI